MRITYDRYNLLEIQRNCTISTHNLLTEMLRSLGLQDGYLLPSADANLVIGELYKVINELHATMYQPAYMHRSHGLFILPSSSHYHSIQA